MSELLNIVSYTAQEAISLASIYKQEIAEMVAGSFLGYQAGKYGVTERVIKNKKASTLLELGMLEIGLAFAQTKGVNLKTSDLIVFGAGYFIGRISTQYKLESKEQFQKENLDK